jgi:hypothetical protein
MMLPWERIRKPHILDLHVVAATSTTITATKGLHRSKIVRFTETGVGMILHSLLNRKPHRL